VTDQPTCSVPTGTVVFTSPTSDVQYSIDGTDYQNSPTFGSVTSGAYILRVRSTNDSTCIASGDTVTVNAVPNAPATPVGSVTDQPTCSTPTGTIVFTSPTSDVQYSIDGTDYQNSPTFGSVTSGAYILRVRSKNDSTCVASGDTVTVNAVPTPPTTPVGSVTDQPTCSLPTGTVVFTDPTTDVQYSIDGTDYQNSTTFDSVTSGAYILRVRSKNDSTCIASGDTVTVNAVPNAPATPVGSVTDQPTCSVPTGTIVFTDPTTDVKYSIDGTDYQNSPTFGSVTSGAYILRVRSKNDSTCIASGDTVTVNAVPTPPTTPVASVTDQPTCSVPTGTIVFTSPTSDIQYSIDGTDYQNSTTFGSVTSGAYILRVRSKNDSTCITSGDTVTVNAVPNAPATPVGSVTDQPTCSVPTGTIVFTDPTTDVKYSIDGTDYQNSTTFGSVTSGAYILRVRSKNDSTCITSGDTVTVNAVPTPPATPVGSVTDQPTCSVPTGTIVFTDPTTDVKYSIDGTDYQNSTTFDSVTPGAYILRVRSKNDSTCVTSGDTVTVNAVPNAPATPVASVTDQPTCSVPTGTIVFTSPTSDVQYSIDGTDYQNSPTFHSVTPDTYILRVRSKNDSTCIASGDTVTVNAVPTPPAISKGNTQNTSACGAADGFIEITGLTQGQEYLPTYDKNGQAQTPISFTASSTTYTIQNLTSGSYTNIKIENRSCESNTLSHSILDPFTPILNITAKTDPTLCSANDGTFTVNGLAPSTYTLLYLRNGFQQTPITFTITGTSYTVQGLIRGTYTNVRVVTNGCVSNNADVFLSDPGAPVISLGTPVQPSSCNSADGSIIISGLTGGITYKLRYRKDGVFQTPITFVANGASYTLEDLPAAIYSNIYVDQGGCRSNSLIQILKDSSGATIAVASTSIPTICGANDGSITISGLSNGLQYILNYVYNSVQQSSLTFTTSGTTYVLTSLKAGSYTGISVTQSGCKSNSVNLILNNPNGPSIDADMVDAKTCVPGSDGAIIVTGLTQGVTHTLTYKKDGIAQSPIAITNTTSTSYIINGLTVGNYSEIKVDQGGCVSNEVTVEITGPILPPALDVPNTLSNDCPAITADLTILTATNNSGLVLNWHSGTPATASNIIPVPEDVGAGTYHAAYFNSLTNCYGPTTPVVMTIVSCVFPPIAMNDVAVTPVNTLVTANVLVNDSDPQNSPFTIAITPVSNPTNGMVTLQPTGNYTYTPTNGFVGEDTFCYEIANGFGLQTTACVGIDVLANLLPENNPLVAVDDNTKTTSSTLTVVILANDSDPDNPNTLNGTLGNPVKLTDPSNGTVVFNANGTVTYTPALGFAGTDSLTYRICDSGTPNLCNEATIRIIVKPTPPAGNQPSVAVDDAKITSVNTPVSNTVAANDSDPDNTPAELTYTKLTNPTSGSVTFNSSGTYTYIPDANFVGNDSYTYQVCDPSTCDVATVQIAVLNLRKVALSPKVWLQGSLFGVTAPGGIMQDSLRAKGLIPLVTPYLAMGFTELSPSDVIGAGILDKTGDNDNDIVDWVFVELRESLDPTNILDTRSALLQRDGDIVEVDGTSAITFNQVKSGSYYVSIQHRNHLGVMSKAPIEMTDVATIVDFRDPLTHTFDFGIATLPAPPINQAQVVVNQGVAMWAGNALFKDNSLLGIGKGVIYQGTENDLNKIYQLITGASGNTFGRLNFILRSYNVGDINMNGETIYQGSGNDVEFIYQNITKNHPGNILLPKQANFIIKEQIPE
jgi:hypothetical protein